MTQNILDEFWVNWDQKDWAAKYVTMSKVARRLVESIPSKEDLNNLRDKTENLQDTKDKCIITPSRELIEEQYPELKKEIEEGRSGFVDMEMPSVEARACRWQLDRGEITIGEYAEKIKSVPRGTLPVVLDPFWADWEKKSLEEQVHNIMKAINYPHEGKCSGIDILNLGAYILDVEAKLGFNLPEG